MNIPGYYDDVLEPEPWERAELKKLGAEAKRLREFLGIDAFHTPPGITPFEALRFFPTLEFNGIGGGYQGAGTKTVIPSKATVKISCRLVSNQTPEKIKALVYKTIRERAPKGVKLTIKEQHTGDALRRGPAGSREHAEESVAGVGEGVSRARPTPP